jgi:hypothetical protein
MKRSLSIVILLCLLFSFTACKQEREPILAPANFYYRNAEIAFGTEDALISAYAAETKEFDGRVLDILNFYVKGPYDSNHKFTFPSGTTVLRCNVSDDTAFIEVSNEFARLSGIDLTIACVCLTKTALELTGTSKATISATSVPLDGNLSITITQDNVLLKD